MAKVVDPSRVEPRLGTIYPKVYVADIAGRSKRMLTEGLGLTQFGVNLTTLAPGARSSHRHAHVVEDECCYILEGEVTLISDEGEQVLEAGTGVGFPANDGNAHQLVNRGTRPAVFLEIGTRSPVEHVTYADVDMDARKVGGRWTVCRKDGRAFD